MENREKLLERVKNLLAMAKHSASNEHEAATALRRAESLMRKHSIEIAELEAKTLSHDDLICAETNESRNCTWVWVLAWAASDLTSTLPGKNSGYLSFYGTKEDTQVAKLMFDYLIAVTERLAQKFDGTRKERNSFKLGIVFAIQQKVKDIKRERDQQIRTASTPGTDLVFIKDNLIKEQYGLQYNKAKSVKVGSASAFDEGQRQGSNVSLNSQIGSTNQPIMEQSDFGF